MKAGEAIAYQKRHDESWPELVGLLHDTGISDYSIFLEEETHRLFAVLRRTIDHKMDALPQHKVMQRWWKFTGDIMEINLAGSPVVIPLQPMFQLVDSKVWEERLRCSGEPHCLA